MLFEGGKGIYRVANFCSASIYQEPSINQHLLLGVWSLGNNSKGTGTLYNVITSLGEPTEHFFHQFKR